MRLIHTIIILLACFFSFGQILTPAKWVYTVSNPSPSVGDEVELVFMASIDKNWYLYSSEFPCEDGPIKTTITFKPNSSYQLVGKLRAIKPLAKHDDIFDCDVKIFKGTGEFRQKIKVLDVALSIAGESEYQVCSDVDGKCIPFSDEFSFEDIHVKGKKKGVSKADFSRPDSIQSSADTPQDPTSVDSQPVNGPTLDKSVIEGVPPLNQESFLGYLLFAFVLGLASLITP